MNVSVVEINCAKLPNGNIVRLFRELDGNTTLGYRITEESPTKMVYVSRLQTGKLIAEILFQRRHNVPGAIVRF